MENSWPTPGMFLKVIDHTYLKTEEEGVSLSDQRKNVEKLILEAGNSGAFSVCVRESMVAFAKDQILKRNSSLKIVSVVGFPLGDKFSLDEKMSLLDKAREDGADEFDMVIPYHAFLSGDEERVYNEIFQMSENAGEQVLKVIFENCYLNNEEKISAYETVIKAFIESKANFKRRFLKTSTGFAKPKTGAVGATLEDISLMHKESKGRFGLKPAGGVKDYQSAIEFFKAAGCPWREEGESIDPYLFRIGSSSLVASLTQDSEANSDY